MGYLEYRGFPEWQKRQEELRKVGVYICERPMEVMMDNKVSLKKDLVAEKLDEMADICEYWKKNRDKGRTPNAIQAALLLLTDELVMLRSAELSQTADPKKED